MKPTAHIQLLLSISPLLSTIWAQENESENSTPDMPPPAAAEEENENMATISEAVIVGSRRQGRSVADSPVPVDVIRRENLVHQGYTDMHSMLSVIVPSYNVNAQPVSGSPSLVRPAYLRGLPGDSTLVLINGKRRHRASVINVFGAGITDGSHGPDLAAIPAIAIKRVEVLRDGSSAQYGSDAVAGVMNLVLRDAAQGGTVETRWGQYYAGDGDTHTIAGNIGMPLTKNGFANFSFEYTKAAPTSRSVQRSNAQGYIDRANELKADPAAVLTKAEMDSGLTRENLIARGERTPVPAQHWGIPEINYDFKFFGNMGLNLSDSAQLYFFPSFAQREMEQGFWYRPPEGGRLFSEPAQLSDGSVFDPRIDLFPGGFTPQFAGVVTDWGLASGIRGELENDWSYDFSGVLGRHRTKFSIWNTVNPQLIHLKEDIPTSYKPGGYTETDYTVNLDISRPFDWEALYSPLHVALGLEYRVEQYAINPGEKNSWFSHRGKDPPKLLNWEKFGIGSDGFPGFNPAFAGKTDRSSYAAWLDLEADVTEAVLLGAAVRYEDYEDFDNTINGKLASRWQIWDRIALRGSLSSGFRVPTVGQANLVDVTSAYNDKGELVNNATLPPTHPASNTLGAKSLEPETSVNATLGTAINIGRFDITIDYYHIKMRDRIALTRQVDLTAAQIADLVEQRAPGADALRTVRYFANAFDTTTQGIDIVANYPIEHLNNSITALTFALNANNTEVEKIKSTGVDAKRKQQVEENLPEVRFSLEANHTQGPWRLMTRLRYYHDFHEFQSDYVGWPIEAQSRLLADAEIGYLFDNGIQLTAGAQNLFDTYPTENSWAGGSGARYPDSSPYGFSGGFYYFKAAYNF